MLIILRCNSVVYTVVLTKKPLNAVKVDYVCYNGVKGLFFFNAKSQECYIPPGSVSVKYAKGMECYIPLVLKVAKMLKCYMPDLGVRNVEVWTQKKYRLPAFFSKLRLLFRQMISRDNKNLINVFIRVTNQMRARAHTEHSASLRSAQWCVCAASRAAARRLREPPPPPPTAAVVVVVQQSERERGQMV